MSPLIQPRAYGIAPPRFRLPDASRLGSVRLQVSDLQRSVDYYERVLGLQVLDARAGIARLSPYGTRDRLVILETGTGVKPARRGAFGLFHFAMLLPDRAALGRFAAHLSAIGVRAGLADHLVSESLYLWDPDGLGIEVYADRPQETWQHHGRELSMTTAPLDIGRVIASGGGAAWDGVPAGTTLGHLHLSVGSLDAAEAFYHRALGFDKTVWTFPGALFLSCGGYHHHLGANTWSPGPFPALDQARLLEWELHVPSAAIVSAAGQSLRASGYEIQDTGDGVSATDPWGARVHIRAGSDCGDPVRAGNPIQ